MKGEGEHKYPFFFPGGVCIVFDFCLIFRCSFGTSSRHSNFLYDNDIGIESGDEIGEFGPIVLHAKEKAVGIPSHELQWLLLRLFFFFLFFLLVLFRLLQTSL